MGKSISEEHPRAYEVLGYSEIRGILKELRKNPEVDLAIKLLAISGYASQKEFSTFDLASLLGVSVASITRWVKIWNERGIEGLKNKTLLMKRERELERICKERQKSEEKKD